MAEDEIPYNERQFCISSSEYGGKPGFEFDKFAELFDCKYLGEKYTSHILEVKEGYDVSQIRNEIENSGRFSYYTYERNIIWEERTDFVEGLQKILDEAEFDWTNVKKSNNGFKDLLKNLRILVREESSRDIDRVKKYGKK